MKLILVFLIIMISTSLTAQSAIIFADLKSHPNYQSHQKSILAKYSSEQWIINGKVLNYGDSILVKVNPNKLDTILFRHHQSSRYIEILTNIKNPNRYLFYPNTCCETFNADILHDNIEISNSIKAKLTEETEMQILCLLDQNGKYLTDRSMQMVKSICDSAMSSEVNKIQVLQVDSCTNSSHCKDLPCLTNSDETMPDQYNTSYEVISTIFECNYISLDNMELTIEIDPTNRKIKLK